MDKLILLLIHVMLGWVLRVSLIESLLEELDRKPEVAKKLARRLAIDIASEEHLRTLLLDAILRESSYEEGS